MPGGLIYLSTSAIFYRIPNFVPPSSFLYCSLRAPLLVYLCGARIACHLHTMVVRSSLFLEYGILSLRDDYNITFLCPVPRCGTMVFLLPSSLQTHFYYSTVRVVVLAHYRKPLFKVIILTHHDQTVHMELLSRGSASGRHGSNITSRTQILST